MNGQAIGVDIGGTNLRVGVVDVEGRLGACRQVATPAGAGRDPDVAGRELVDTIVATLDDVLAEAGHGEEDLPMGVGFAGGISRDGRAVYGSNVATRNLPLRDLLAERIGHDDVVVVNDANAATWGEFRHGGGRDADDLVMVTVGTGVGGGVVSDGRLVVGRQGFGGEVGHMVVARDGWECTCGRRGCLEAYAAGKALGRHARDLLDEGGSSLLQQIEDFDPADVTWAASAGDDLATAAIRRLAGWLGVGISSLVTLLDPGVVLIGGGVTEHIGRWLLPAAEEAMRAQVFAGEWRTPPVVRLAELGDRAGMIGAADMARRGARRGVRRDTRPSAGAGPS